MKQNSYDADGTRVQKEENDSVKKYYYVGNNMVCTTDNGSAVFTGIYDSNEVVGAYLGVKPEYTLYCTDMQGSTSMLIGGDLQIEGGYAYSDYGEVDALDGTPEANEICYTGAVYDRTTGEHYLRARYYDPEAAVFTTQDTLKGDTEDSSLWNSYAYCNGDPVNHIDPSGHRKEPIYDISNRLDSAMKTHLKWLLRKWIRASKPRCKLKRAKRMVRLYYRFYKLVRTGGKWDLKKQWNTKLISYFKQIRYHGKKIDHDDPGNIHFGFVGCVLFPSEVLIAGAGVYQLKTDYRNIAAIKERVKKLIKRSDKWKVLRKRLKSYGDDPKDSKCIRQGYKDGMNYKKLVIDKWVKKTLIPKNVYL